MEKRKKKLFNVGLRGELSGSDLFAMIGEHSFFGLLQHLAEGCDMMAQISTPRTPPSHTCQRRILGEEAAFYTEAAARIRALALTMASRAGDVPPNARELNLSDTIRAGTRYSADCPECQAEFQRGEGVEFQLPLSTPEA